MKRKPSILAIKPNQWQEHTHKSSLPASFKIFSARFILFPKRTAVNKKDLQNSVLFSPLFSPVPSQNTSVQEAVRGFTLSLSVRSWISVNIPHTYWKL